MQAANEPVPARRLASGSYPDDSKHVMDYLRVVYKRRWVLIPVFLVGFVGGSVNTLRETPVYQSRLQLLIESGAPKVARLDQMFDDGSMSDEFRQTQFRILRSRSIARQTITNMRLWDRPSLGDAPPQRWSVPSVTSLLWGGFWATLRGGAAVASLVSPSKPPTVEAQAKKEELGESRKQLARIDQFLGGLSIAPVPGSRIVQIIYTSSDPVFAAEAANAVAKTYIEQSRDARFNSSKDAADWLNDRLTEYRSALKESEAALQTFRERHNNVAVVDAGSNIVVQRLVELNTALTKAKTERINKEALYTQLKAAEAGGTIDSVPAVMANDQIQKLRTDLSDLQRQATTLSQRYGERNAEMIKARNAVEVAEAKLKLETSRTVESIKSEYEASGSEERSLQDALNAQKGEALGLNRTGIEFGVLQREVESNRQIYQNLLQRSKETGISLELPASNVRIVDPAEVPRSPVSPDIQRGVSVAFGSSLLVALGLVFGLEYFDNRIKRPEQIREALGLPFLGLVPAIPAKAMNGAPPLLYNDVPAGFAESIRTLRTNLLFSSAEEGPRSLVVTSTGPGEGKTVIACNIALTLAQAGQRVILIDADMRRPRVHEMFTLKQEPGLSNLIVGQVQQAAAIKLSSVPGLSLLTAGHETANPSELLGSARFKLVLAALKKQFDWVILDSPPVMAVTDSCILAHDATDVLFVVGSEMTSTGIARVAVDRLENSGAMFAGALLNRAQVNRHAYYYPHYYHRKYASYYTKTAKS